MERITTNKKGKNSMADNNDNKNVHRNQITNASVYVQYQMFFILERIKDPRDSVLKVFHNEGIIQHLLNCHTKSANVNNKIETQILLIINQIHNKVEITFHNV